MDSSISNPKSKFTSKPNEATDHHEQPDRNSLKDSTSGINGTSTAAWFCPSRWLLAYHDPQANIYTLSSHMCLADLNDDGENLLAFIDFKQSPLPQPSYNETSTSRSRADHGLLSWHTQQQTNLTTNGRLPYYCRLRIYRGQQLIYNHFLDDIPSCLIATSIGSQFASISSKQTTSKHFSLAQNNLTERVLLTLPINDDIYFYHKLKPSHRISLEDADTITETLNKSEYDAWQMVKQNKVDTETLRELLIGLSNELGDHELTSHSCNFLALENNEERQKYLMLWKFKRLTNGIGEHLMSMDTICCAESRLKYTSNITRSGDFGRTHESAIHNLNSNTAGNFNQINWNRILDIQRDGLVLGTEDKHVLIYDLRTTKAYLESNYRLPSTPDHILVERRSPASFQLHRCGNDLKKLTYKILISCRNCRIYSIDENYLITKKDTSQSTAASQVTEIVRLKCNVVEMCWSGDLEDEPSPILTDEKLSSGNNNEPNFVVACLDKRVYCFSSSTGDCKWIVESELPLTCILSFPTPQSGSSNDSNLIGIASQASRIDFFVSSTGRIVDSIYFNDDYCQAMVFGRFGREDNCLCVTTKLGHLLIFILKRTAKFANAQCLSSAASYATDVLINSIGSNPSIMSMETSSQKQLSKHLSEPAQLPSAFTLTKTSISNPNNRGADPLQLDHNCDRIVAKNALEAQLAASQLQVPIKGRDFVDQIVEQSRNSVAISRLLTRHMVKLRDKIKSTMDQQCELVLDSNCEVGNRIMLSRIIGLGDTYRASVSVRLNMKQFADHYHLSEWNTTKNENKTAPKDSQYWSRGRCSLGAKTSQISLLILLFPAKRQQQQIQIKPIKFEYSVNFDNLLERQLILEKTIEFKLIRVISLEENLSQQTQEERESISLDVLIFVRDTDILYENDEDRAKFRFPDGAMPYPLFMSSVRVPLN